MPQEKLPNMDTLHFGKLKWGQEIDAEALAALEYQVNPLHKLE